MNFNDLPYWGQLALIAVLCAAMGFVFYQFIYSPIVEEVNGMESRLGKLREEIKQYKPHENNKEGLEADIAQIKIALKQIENIFPSVKDDVEIKRFVESIANEFDIEVSSYRTGSIIDSENYLERQVNYQTRGRTIDYLRFFDALVRRDQVVHIYGSKFQRGRGDGAEFQRYPVSSTFTISSYVYKPLEDVEQEGEEQ